MEKVTIAKDLLKIKDIIGSPRKLKIRDSKDEYLILLKELGHRVDKMEKSIKDEGAAIDLKRKSQLLYLLKNEKLTSEEVGKRLNLSRSRANQYLKVMESDGIVAGTLDGKKKYYTAVNKCEE